MLGFSPLREQNTVLPSLSLLLSPPSSKSKCCFYGSEDWDGSSRETSPEWGVCPLVGKALVGTFPNKQAYEKNKATLKLIMDF